MSDSPVSARPVPFTAYEFFAGGGMARAGLGDGWRCLFANDIDPAKGAAYAANWGDADLVIGDIGRLGGRDLPGRADLAWGSFPCQDLSLAGAGAGLDGRRSGTFYAFWDVIHGLIADGRAPGLVAIENVCGALTSRGGQDFGAICRTFADAGYRAGPLVINADRFLPQSRPRLFVVGVRADRPIRPDLQARGPEGPFHPPALVRAVEALPPADRASIVWWRLPEPGAEPATLAEIVEADPADLRWHAPHETRRLLSLMAPRHRAGVDAAVREGRRAIGAVFRRTRQDAEGRKVQRAEVRFDRAGCLRTPAGGSSRQMLVVIEAGRVRSRLMSPRETARLMGLGDDYQLPASYASACHLTGDGVAVPVVRHLAEHLFEPLLADRIDALKAA